MKQAYNTPNLTFVRLPKNDAIITSPQTLTVDFSFSTSDWHDIGAADRFRDWE